MDSTPEHVLGQNCWCNPYVLEEGINVVMRGPAVIVRADPLEGIPMRMAMHVEPINDGNDTLRPTR